MKKNTHLNLAPVAVAAVLAMGGVAHAQSSVELYGTVDVGYTSVSGLKAGTVSQIASGVMEGSRWGLRGNEDMGGGYKALFVLESRFEADTGGLSNTPISGTQLPDRMSTATALGLNNAFQPAVTAVNASLAQGLGVNTSKNLFDRQAYLGVITPVGAIIAGRQYTPGYEIFAGFDSMKADSALSVGQIASLPAGIDIRLSNTLQYRVQLGGFTASLMTGFGELEKSSMSQFNGVMASYKGNGFSVGVGHNTRNNELGATSLTNTVLGASLDVGPGTLSSSFSTIEDKNPSGLSTIAGTLTPLVGASNAAAIQAAYVNAFKQDGELFHIGYRMKVGAANTVTVSYNSLNDKTKANADVKSYGVAFSHALSKRTDISTVVAKADNSANSQVALGGGGYLGGVSEKAGKDSTSIALAVRHRF